MATMQVKKKKKKYQPCSKLKSFYFSCRGHLPCSSSSSSSNKYLPINPIPLSQIQPLPSSQHNKKSSQKPCSSTLLGDHHRNETAEVHWRRVSDLERQLVELEGWLHTELARLRIHLGTNKNSNHNSTNFEGERCKLGRLDGDGGYLYSLYDNKVLIDGALCQDLAIQFSSPALVPPEDESSISEILNQMAMMGRENLITWLLDSIPMTNISTDKPCITPCTAVSKDFEEAILINAIPKLGELVLEGLQIQMGVKEVVKRQQREINVDGRNENIDEVRIYDDARGYHGGDGGEIIMVVLIQPRDPRKVYRPINEMMIGFVEAVNGDEEEGGEGEFIIRAVHVAGLMARRRNGKVIRNCLWCLSLPN